MVFKRNPKQYLLSIIICASVAIPIVCWPVGLSNKLNAAVVVRRAYDAKNPVTELPVENVLVEEWALVPIIPISGNDDLNGNSDGSTGSNPDGDIVGPDLTGEGSQQGQDGQIGQDGQEGQDPQTGVSPVGDGGIKYTDDGLIDISQGGVVSATYIDGYVPQEVSYVSTRYSDVPTFTVVQQYDEANLPIELLDTQVFAPDDTYYYIGASNSIVKETPDMSSVTLTTIALGTGVTRIGIGDSWSKIRTESGVEGYVLTNSLSIDPVHIAIDRTVWVDCDSLTLRESNSTDSETLATLPRDTRLRCIEIVDKWYKVITPGGLEGYVYISYTTTNAPPTPTPVPTRRPSSSSSSSSSSGSSSKTGNVASLPVITGCNGESIVNICVSMLGVDYVWAGESSTGVDCSGLVVYAYRQLGISVPHFAQSITTCGINVAREDIALGDVVCWNTGGGYCGHVGIYVGGGQVIHASNSRDNVCYGSVDMMPIVTIRRFIQ